jgi:uncharacterized protein (DUF305 family)
MSKTSCNIHFILSLIIFLIILIGIFFYSNTGTTICNKQLTDNEFIDHMITHHEVAVYMSEKHLHNTKNPIILDILRKVITIQKYEINILKHSKVIGNNNNNDFTKPNVPYLTQGDFTKPNTPNLSNTFCDPGFFKISHGESSHNMTDEMYIQHMIPHHQVAVDMSKMILKTTNNNFLIDFAYKTIHNQQSEIILLHNLLQSKYSFKSNIV